MSSQKSPLLGNGESTTAPPPDYTAQADEPIFYRQYDQPQAEVQYTDQNQQGTSQEMLAKDPGVLCGLNMNILGLTFSCFVDRIRSTSQQLSQQARSESLDQRACPCGQPRLQILAATFGDLDVTAKVRSLVTAEQTLSIDTITTSHIFGDPWYGTVKTICILYQYEGRDVELVVSHEREGMVRIDHRVPVSASRVKILRNGKILAVVWGIKDGLSDPAGEKKLAVMEKLESFPCTNKWFGFDGFPNWRKCCVVFVRDGNGVKIISARENRTCYFPGGSSLIEFGS
jgi:hypothetical protein